MLLLTHNELQLSLPAEWVDQSHVIAVAPEGPAFRANVVLTTETLPAGESLETVANRQVEQLKPQFPNYKLWQQTATKIGPHSGILRNHTFAAYGTNLAQLQFVIAHGSRVYTITYSDTMEGMLKSKEVGMAIFASLQLKAISDGFEKKAKLMELSPQAAPAPEPTADAPKSTISLPRGPVRG